MVKRDRWVTAVYTSEWGFLLHLPYFIDLEPAGQSRSAGHTPSYAFVTFVFVARLVCNAVCLHALYWQPEAAAAQILHLTVVSGLVIASVVLHLISYCHTRFHLAMHTPSLPAQPMLYAAAHFSLLNFVLDLPGHNVPAVTLSHLTIVLVNIVCAALLAFTALTVEPIQEAWWCYTSDDVRDYKYGMCPKPCAEDMRTQFCAGVNFDPVCHNAPATQCRVEDAIPHDILAEWTHIARQAMAAMAGLYLFTIKDKLVYYRTL